VVTGGGGFLGSHLCERLLALEHSVLCIDNLSTGSRVNIQHLEGNPGFEFRLHDISKPVEVTGRVDAVAHLASPASPPDYLRLPIQTLKVGSLGTHNALGLAKAKQARFLLASTSEVYGDPLVNPQPESYWGNVNPTGPRGVYDEAKRFAEAMTVAYHRYHGLDTRIARIFNTYGPRMRPQDGRVVSNFIVQALRGEPLTVYGDGSQTRSLCYVSDLVEGLTRLLLADGREGSATVARPKGADESVAYDLEGIHGPVNLGNPTEMTVREIAGAVLCLTGSPSIIGHRPLPVDDPRMRCPNVGRATMLLDWKPVVDLQKGLEDCIAYFRQVMSEPGYKVSVPRFEVGC